MTGARHRARAGAVSLAVLFGLAACTGGSDAAAPSSSSTSPAASTAVSSSAPSPTPSPSVSMPASLTPAEAKAATSAIEAYRQYTLVLDQVRQNGGQGAELLKTVATQQALAGGTNSAAIYASRKWRFLGQTRLARLAVRSVSLQQAEETHTVPEVILDTCEDLSATDVVDASGASVRPRDLAERWKTAIWVRYYPKSGGTDGWLVGRHENEGAPSC
jgi:hypothetical protein